MRNQALDEKVALLNKKKRFFNECNNLKKDDCEAQKDKGRLKCYYHDNTGDCRPHKSALNAITKNLTKVEAKLDQLDMDILQEN